MVVHGSSSLKLGIIRLFLSNIHGDELILVLYSRGLGNRSVKLAQMQAGGLYFRNLPPSSLECYRAVLCRPTRLLCLLHDRY